MIETFNKFNNGMRRQDRRRHMELCGFELKSRSVKHPDDYKFIPKERAEKYIKSGFSHVVYFVGGRDSWGNSIYYYYVK